MALVFLLLCLLPKPWQAPVDLGAIERAVWIYSWWAGLINLLALALLAATTPWWTRSLPANFAARIAAPLPRGFRLVVLGAMLACAAQGAFRMGDSLWHDEEYSVRRAILGTYRIKDDDTVKLKELSWSHTFWSYRKPTNHIFQSILSRLSLSAWRIVARPRGLQINEVAVRLPSYLAGILSIGAAALLMARAGLPWAGALTAWLLALHPWHLKLAPEARGYALLFLFIPLIALCALHALDTGRWKWWLSLALVEFALLYTWPPALFIVLVLNFCLGACLWLDTGRASSRGVLAGRWLASGTAALMLLVQLMLPCLPQFHGYSQGSQGFALHRSWFENVGSLLFMGGLWSKTGSKTSSPYWEVLPQATAHPALTLAAIALASFFLVAGLVALWRNKPHGRWLAIVFLLPGPLVFAIAVIQGQYLFEWYLAFLLPGLVATAAVGILQTGMFLRRTCAFSQAPAVMAAMVLAAFVVLTWQTRAFLLRQSAQPYRESVLLTRPHLDPNTPENRLILTASTLLIPDVYDPRVRKAKTIEDYLAVMNEAEERAVPLYVNNGFPDILKDTHPDIDAFLSDPQVFELVARLKAVEPLLDRTVHKYRPGSLKDVDLSRYRRQPANPTDPDEGR